MSPTAARLARPLVSASAALVGLVAVSAAACDPDPGYDPCALDRLGCAEPDPDDSFYLDTCPPDLTDPLEVTIGSGETSFAPLSAGAGPTVIYGPQGGQHVFMGVRVANARLDHSPRLRLRFYLGQGDGCVPPPPGTTTIPECAVTLGRRELVLGGAGFQIDLDPGGAVEEWGLVVFVEVPSPDLPGLVAVTVEDQCRRQGAMMHAWTSYR